MEALAHKITLLAIRRRWLQADQYEWCMYTLVKCTGTILFFSVVVMASLLLRRFRETIVFVLVAYLLRRRIGGYHAKTALQCQLMSFGITGFNTMIICPTIRHIVPVDLILFISLSIAVVLLVTKPTYPEQLHFTEKIKEKNNTRKNAMIGATVLFTLVSYIAMPELLPSILTGLLVVLIGVAVEINTLRHGGKENEGT